MIESPSKSLFHCKQANIHIDIQCIKRQTFDNHECLLNVRRTGDGWMRLLGGLWQGVLAECIARGPIYTSGYGCGRSGKHQYPAPPTTASCPGEIRGGSCVRSIRRSRITLVRREPFGVRKIACAWAEPSNIRASFCFPCVSFAIRRNASAMPSSSLATKSFGEDPFVQFFIIAYFRHRLPVSY